MHFLTIKANCYELDYDYADGPDQIIFIGEPSDAHVPSNMADVFCMLLRLVRAGAADADHSG